MSITINASTSAGLIVSPDTSGNFVFQNNGTNSLVLPTSGTVTIPSGTGTAAVQGVSTNIVSSTAQASTSGTSITFSSIPSWVKRISLLFNGVSTNGSSPVLIQLGSGSATTSGYLCGTLGGINNASTAAANYTTGFGIEPAGSLVGATVVRHGVATIANVSGNIWTASGSIGHSDIAAAALFGGTVTLSGTLDRVILTTVNGTDTFDAGSVNILYE